LELPTKVFFTVTASRSSALQFPVYGFFSCWAWRVELRETVFRTFVGGTNHWNFLLQYLPYLYAQASPSYPDDLRERLPLSRRRIDKLK